MAAPINDEEFARKVQNKFDNEALINSSELEDYKLARQLSRVHELSDSDATLEPDSDDLFNDSDENIKKTASKPSITPKRSSTLHEISDSNSEDECVTSRPSDKQCNISNKRTTLKHKEKIDAASKIHDLFGSDSDSDSCYQKSNQRTKMNSSFSLLKKKDQKVTVSRNSNVPLKSNHKKEFSLAPGCSKSSNVKREHCISDSDSDDTIDLSDKEESSIDTRPRCQYGKLCYRKSSSHLKAFKHIENYVSYHKATSDKSHSPPRKRPKHDSSAMLMPTNIHSSPSSASNVKSKCEPNFGFGFQLTKVSGIPDKYNDAFAVNLQDILSPKMGDLVASCQFDYMFDIPWMMSQYPEQFRTKPLMIVHGEQRKAKTALAIAADPYSNIRLCQARLEIAYGTHHTKMMFLLYSTGMRVVIHTANMVERDWYQKTQGVWISPVFPKLPENGSSNTGHIGDSVTHFKRDLLEYVAAYKATQLKEWQRHITEHDMTASRVYIIGSTPGRHIGKEKNSFGHLKLRKVLETDGPSLTDVRQWPLVGQFSSIGSMGPSKDTWLCGEWLDSLAAGRGFGVSKSTNKVLQLIFPSKENIRLSLEGYPGGQSVPYSHMTAKKQVYLHDFFHNWKSSGRGRSKAVPHIKTYLRATPDWKSVAWILVTSANLSKAAWGALEKNGGQLMIRSYEIGVLFLPKHFVGQDTVPALSEIDEIICSDGAAFPMPFDLPPVAYAKQDRPWMWDIPYVDLPDSNGNKWCPK